MVATAGWELPAEYSGATDEHMAVRTRAGLFDLSHMGQIELAGRDALAAVQLLTSNDAARLKPGELQHSALTTPAGTFVDALDVYRLGRDHFLCIVNASALVKDVAWIVGQAKPFGDVALVDSSSRHALLALQGPVAKDVVQGLANMDLSAVGAGCFAHGELGGARVTIARTGITGEDGYEVLLPPQSTVRVWEAILRAGRDAGVIPAGQNAFDTLRLEAGERLYGRDIDDTTSVLEAGLEGIVAWEKGEFTGRASLADQRARGVSRRLSGFEMAEPVAIRPGCAVFVDGRRAGEVTSGAQTPFLKKSVGMAYLPADRTEPGTAFQVDVGDRRVTARAVPLPFYERSKG